MIRTTFVVRAAAALAAVLTISACDSQQVTAEPRSGTPRDSAEQVLYGGRTVLAFNGLRRGDVTSDTVLVFDAATRFELSRIRATFTTALGRPLSTLTAPSGTYRVANDTFEVHGKVAIASDTSHRRLDGTELRFDIAKNELTSDSAFTATSGTRKLSGVGFKADPGLFSVKCVKNCVGGL